MLGVESLSHNRYQKGQGARSLFAALLGIIPGMGAVYNRQNLKAAVHFIAVVGAFQLTNLRIMPGFFVLTGFALYVYSIIDAYRTAQRISMGESAAANEADFKRSLVRIAPYAGLFFIVCGIISVVQLVHPIPLLTIMRLLPVALILLGGYLLTRYFRRSADDTVPKETPAPPYSLTPSPMGGQHSSGHVRLLRRNR